VIGRKKCVSEEKREVGKCVSEALREAKEGLSEELHSEQLR
jgi:hypothetical protein